MPALTCSDELNDSRLVNIGSGTKYRGDSSTWDTDSRVKNCTNLYGHVLWGRLRHHLASPMLLLARHAVKLISRCHSEATGQRCRLENRHASSQPYFLGSQGLLGKSISAEPHVTYVDVNFLMSQFLYTRCLLKAWKKCVNV